MTIAIWAIKIVLTVRWLKVKKLIFRRIHMIKNNSVLKIISLLTAIFWSAPSFALDGCVDSPENPTLVLGLIGLAAAITPWANKKIQRNKKNNKINKQ
jgi:hypothetical protein